MKLILTRHGETEENKAGIIQGHLHGTLSVLGKSQAEKLALRFKDEKIDFIYSSDLARAADTAKEIAKHHPETQVKFVKELREIYLGEFQGKKKEDTLLGNKDVNYAEPKDGESREALSERAKKFIHKVLEKHPNNTVLFVGHNGINKAIISAVTGKKYEDVHGPEKQHNTGVNIFEIDEDKNHKIHCFNCIKHLD